MKTTKFITHAAGYPCTECGSKPVTFMTTTSTDIIIKYLDDNYSDTIYLAQYAQDHYKDGRIEFAQVLEYIITRNLPEVCLAKIDWMNVANIYMDELKYKPVKIVSLE